MTKERERKIYNFLYDITQEREEFLLVLEDVLRNVEYTKEEIEIIAGVFYYFDFWEEIKNSKILGEAKSFQIEKEILEKYGLIN